MGILIGFPFASHCKPGLICLEQIVLPLNPQTHTIVNTATAMVYRLGCCTCLLHGHLVSRLVCHIVSFQEYLLNDFVSPSIDSFLTLMPEWSYHWAVMFPSFLCFKTFQCLPITFRIKLKSFLCNIKTSWFFPASMFPTQAPTLAYWGTGSLFISRVSHIRLLVIGFCSCTSYPYPQCLVYTPLPSFSHSAFMIHFSRWGRLLWFLWISIGIW